MTSVAVCIGANIDGDLGMAYPLLEFLYPLPPNFMILQYIGLVRNITLRASRMIRLVHRAFENHVVLMLTTCKIGGK